MMWPAPGGHGLGLSHHSHLPRLQCWAARCTCSECCEPGTRNSEFLLLDRFWCSQNYSEWNCECWNSTRNQIDRIKFTLQLEDLRYGRYDWDFFLSQIDHNWISSDRRQGLNFYRSNSSSDPQLFTGNPIHSWGTTVPFSSGVSWFPAVPGRGSGRGSGRLILEICGWWLIIPNILKKSMGMINHGWGW